MIKQHIDWPMCRERGVGPKKRKARVMACVGARSKSTGRILMRRERCMKDLKWKRNNVHGGLGKLWKGWWKKWWMARDETKQELLNWRAGLAGGWNIYQWMRHLQREKGKFMCWFGIAHAKGGVSGTKTGLGLGLCGGLVGCGNIHPHILCVDEELWGIKFGKKAIYGLGWWTVHTLTKTDDVWWWSGYEMR